MKLLYVFEEALSKIKLGLHVSSYNTHGTLHDRSVKSRKTAGNKHGNDSGSCDAFIKDLSLLAKSKVGQCKTAGHCKSLLQCALTLHMLSFLYAPLYNNTGAECLY